ncbi:recombination-associated protein RdgC [Hafnia alvei]|uniref:Recombination-associated protein RdgC n=2 Tax=Hafnia alvei TaxID=569 RepID=A0A377PIG4_HAFAL|nr:recombination-associated protein RdgC [Hafnia alvei]KFC87620.1 hypothetical protein GHAL_2315 [Hafnia alvei ATCC 13337]RLR07864.1 exonuclease [Hafnia alvei ATCC 13337]WQD26804.1 recombination-associated protein RdgC [Hafnia alvei]STQ79761.1 Recombination-associated protein rdgC [Hafnia alvei]
MKLAQIKNAIVFKATLPNADLLEGHMKECMFSDISETEFARSGFAVNTITGELVTPITGGYTITVRRDEKIIPSSVVNKEVETRVAAIELNSECKLKRKDKAIIKNNVIVELCKTAFVKTTYLFAYYDEANKLLIVATGSKPLSDIVVSLLVKACGSVKTETINVSDVKHGLTTRLRTYLTSGLEPFEGFRFSDFIQLGRLGDQKEIIKYSGSEIDDMQQEIIDKLDAGFIVEKVRLDMDGISFQLTEKFHFKAINLLSDINYQNEDDLPYRWRQEAGVKLFFMRTVVLGLVSVLEYKAEK